MRYHIFILYCHGIQIQIQIHVCYLPWMHIQYFFSNTLAEIYVILILYISLIAPEAQVTSIIIVKGKRYCHCYYPEHPDNFHLIVYCLSCSHLVYTKIVCFCIIVQQDRVESIIVLAKTAIYRVN